MSESVGALGSGLVVQGDQYLVQGDDVVRDNSKMAEGGRYLGGRVTADGTPAPQCLMTFKCPYAYQKPTWDGGGASAPKKRMVPDGVCGGVTVQDAYRGPVQCLGPNGRPHAPTFMIPDSFYVGE